MTADEINERLGEFMGEYDLFTDSLDACEWVADKLDVADVDIERLAEGFVAYVRVGDYYRGKHGPTRAHALAAALYAAVKGATDV